MEDIISCMTEAELDTVEIRLREKIEDSLSEGKVAEAENIEESIKGLDEVPLCIKPEDRTRGFSMMMRDRARYL